MSLLSLFFFFFIAMKGQVFQSLAQYNTSSCPLDFNVLRELVKGSARPNLDSSAKCQYIRQGLRLVQSQYLKSTNSFLPPLNSSESCWDSYQTLVDEFTPNFNIRSSCGFETATQRNQRRSQLVVHDAHGEAFSSDWLQFVTKNLGWLCCGGGGIRVLLRRRRIRWGLVRFWGGCVVVVVELGFCCGGGEEDGVWFDFGVVVLW